MGRLFWIIQVGPVSSQCSCKRDRERFNTEEGDVTAEARHFKAVGFKDRKRGHEMQGVQLWKLGKAGNRPPRASGESAALWLA